MRIVGCLMVPILLALEPSAADSAEAQWFKGQLHAHSYWSDGRGFPDQAIQAYRERGYDFVSLTEHNRFADDPNHWRKVEESEGEWPPNVTRVMYEAYVRDFGKDAVDSRMEGDVLEVRLKTHAELKEQFEVPGEFLLMPGVEITQEVMGRSPHLNYINLPSLIPSLRNVNLIDRLAEPELTVSRLIARNLSEVSALGDALQLPWLLLAAHPQDVYSILPQDVLDNSGLRFFEIYNNGAAIHPQAPSYTLEKFWDAVNAFRCEAGQSLLYGVATDDAHFYDPERIDGYAGVNHGWVMVRAESLTPQNILRALHRGDFYATSGVYLEKVEFDPQENRLDVKVNPQEGVRYTIHFITTKAGFDRSVSHISVSEPERELPVYSDDIGRTAKTVSGTEASYVLGPDELYVRARIESDQPNRLALDPQRAHLHPKVQAAWTQPFRRESK